MVMHMGMGIAGPSRLRLAPTLLNLRTASPIIPSRTFATATPTLPTSTYPSGTALPAAHDSTSSSSSSGEDGTNHNSGPSPDSEPQPKSAYARFKLLTKKYGWYALGMYTALSSVDFSLAFLTVHALGVERIEPLFGSIMFQYRSIRYGKDAAEKIATEHRVAKEEEKRREKKEIEENGGKKKNGYWGSRAFWAEAVLAYGIHKTLLLPFRAGLTVAWTPKVVNWLSRNGWIGKVSRGLFVENSAAALARLYLLCFFSPSLGSSHLLTLISGLGSADTPGGIPPHLDTDSHNPTRLRA
jgi:hypothetical protein